MQREQLRYLCMSHIRNALGYALAEAMFQQAGWSSEGIDVSYDPLVAMSFALTTWDARGGHLRPRENPAVIYRWTVDDRSWTLDDLRAHNFYSCPSFVPTRSICRLLQRGTASSFRESVARYKDAIGWNLLEFDLDAVQGRRPFELISLPEAWMTDSRVERQAAGLIIPDQSRPEVLAELARRDDLGMMCDDARDDRGDRVPVGRVLSGGSFVENVAARPGVERFLVDVSSSKGIEEASPISPDVLLPTTDASFDLLANWISPYYAPAVQYGTMPLEVGQIFIDPIALWTALGEPEPERQFSR
ncbi:MAG: hypothetical protein HOQ26_08995 [Gemmatimonadaceae bacterium]|nr:hypothetical protein [Gemmatimonadaceae bacterium]NUQ93030.1 hypothetical protein [Gemmatimonadaceae bacterium]